MGKIILSPTSIINSFCFSPINMKNILLFICTLVTLSSYAQKKCGHVNYEYIMPAEKLVMKESTLFFNDSVSKFVFDKIDHAITPESKIKTDVNSISLSFSSTDEQGSSVFRNFLNETILVREAKTEKLFESFLYEDTWVKIDWEIQENTKKIGKYTCKKAIGDFRGRTYIAWFTEEIPLPYGPWKLHGLPGLILQAEDTEKMFRATFKSITYPTACETSDLERPTAAEIKTLKEYVDFLDNYNDIVFQKMQSRLPRHLANNMQQISKPDNGRKYRDEKVFEWEK
mgnify:CR=1 FL=1